MKYPRRLVSPCYPSPLSLSTQFGDHIANFVDEELTVPFALSAPISHSDEERFSIAGPREFVAFQGENVVAGILTCGGLCPGLNDVIRALVGSLWSRYGVRQILGFRYGYYGLSKQGVLRHPPFELSPERLRSAHRLGGSTLGSSRGEIELDEMVETLLDKGITQLYCIGGDGTMRGATALAQRLNERGVTLSVIGVPKTIDNDLPFVERTFGFDTAVSMAVEAVRAARAEASSALRGVGVVKLMGRHAGFIAASAAIASREADLVLIPELPFEMLSRDQKRPKGIIPYLEQVLNERGEAVIIVAEGVGQGQEGQPRFVETQEKDASGNRRLGDAGQALCTALKSSPYFSEPFNLKYIDPSYMIRATPVSSSDAMYCAQLAEDAVHAGMAGFTETLVGRWGGIGTLIPFSLIRGKEKRLDLDGTLWRNALEATGQPSLLLSSDELE